MRIWRDVGEALTRALMGDWEPENIVTFYHASPTGSAMAILETPLGTARRRERFWRDRGRS